MKKLFKGFKLSNFIPNIIIGFAYPIIKGATSDSFAFGFSDACFIVGLVFALIGVFYSLYLHGDFDITSYITKRTLTKDKKETFEIYEENINEKRKDSFNYPLLLCIILIIASYIATLFV